MKTTSRVNFGGTLSGIFEIKADSPLSSLIMYWKRLLESDENERFQVKFPRNTSENDSWVIVLPSYKLNGSSAVRLELQRLNTDFCGAYQTSKRRCNLKSQEKFRIGMFC